MPCLSLKWRDIYRTQKATRSQRASCPGRSRGGAGKEGELATTSLEFEYLHRNAKF